MVVWEQLNPANEETISAKVVTDFIKLIYDPYMIGQNTEGEAMQKKIQLTIDYITELRRITKSSERMEKGYHSGRSKLERILDQDSPEYGIPRNKVKTKNVVTVILKELRYLTSNYLNYRLTSKGIKIPNTRETRVL